jgi:hypothetical protein
MVCRLVLDMFRGFLDDVIVESNCSTVSVQELEH